MSELAVGFYSLPEEFQNVIRLAQDRHHIAVTPLQALAGGWSGAIVFLVSVASQSPDRIEHFVLKLDRKNEKLPFDEIQRHDAAARQSPPDFAAQHLAQVAFERVEADGVIAIFYSIAGQSLHRYRTLSAYDRQSQLETIFAHTYRHVLSEWNAARTFKQAVHPTALLEQWLNFRLKPGNQIEKFLETVLHIPLDLAGFLIQGSIFPNPLAYARNPEWWGTARPIDAAIGLQHGDLNTNNILVKFARNEETLEGYYLIDFALFKEQMPLLLDLRYLEMSYLILRQAQVSFAKLVDLVARLGEADSLDPQRVPVDVAVVCAIIGSARQVFDRWVADNHPSLHDDLWGQYWLAGVAAGLSYCHKPALGQAERLTGLVYAAANLKRYAALFGIPTPTEGRQLYDLAQFRQDKPPGDSTLAVASGSPRTPAAQATPVGQTPPSPFPVGEVTFLYSDIEGSTPLWESQPEQMRGALEIHNAAVRTAAAAHGGQVFKMVGDAFQIAFSQPAEAIAAAVEAQRNLLTAKWGTLGPLRVRMGLHLGPGEFKEGDYVTSHTLNRVARIMSAGHGGQILLSNEVVEKSQGQLPTGVTLRDMGQHRLKGMTRLEHLFQVVAPDLPADFPKLNTLDPAPNNLPAELTNFIGREAELSSLKALLGDAHNRLVTITAPGGMGKTRLSVEAASQVYEAFPQGVYFVALDRLTSADQIVQAVAEVLPISLATNEDPKARVIDYLRGKTALLVMDNFEHVLDGASVVQDILGAALHVRVLATSRVRLNLMSETVFSIEGLAVDGSSLEKSSAIQLFAESARRTQPRFELNRAVLPAVTRICRLVDGMPLAILLAAAWIDTLSVDEIAAEIEKSIDILETEKRDVPERQRSVRAVIGSSWNQVDASAQNLLKRLSVFRGGFTRTAAQEAAGASLRGLSQLVDKALLRRDPDTGRYSIHELLRQYAEEQLKQSSDEDKSAHEAHARYFAEFMQTSAIRVHDSRLKVALMEIESDLDNIRIAWNYWSDKQDASRLLQFIDALWMFFEIRSSIIPAIQLFDAAAQKLTSTEPDIVCARAEIRARRAWFTALIGLPAEGLRMAEESITILRQHNRDVGVLILGGVTVNAIWLNKIEMMSRITQEMLARAEQSGDRFERAWALIWWAYALMMQHQVDRAVQAAEQGLAISKELDNPFISAWSAAALGIGAAATGDTSSAKTQYLGAVQQAERINFVRMLLICSETLGTLALMENDIEQAQQFSLACLRISRDSGQTREMLASLRDLASVYIAQGNPEAALQLLAVVLRHPASEQNSMSSVQLNRPERLRDEAEKLRVQIESQLDQTLYQSAWESGQKNRLAEVVAQILT